MTCKICNRPVNDITDHWDCGVERLRRMMEKLAGRDAAEAYEQDCYSAGGACHICGSPGSPRTFKDGTWIYCDECFDNPLDARSRPTMIEPEQPVSPGIEPGDDLRALIEAELILSAHWHERHGCNCGRHI